MKNKHILLTYSHSKDCNQNSKNFMEFEMLAVSLDQLSRSKLPDGCLNGVLRSMEGEIRQDAVLLALRWFGQHNAKEPWDPMRSIAHALRFVKMRYARKWSGNPKHVQLDEAILSSFTYHDSFMELTMSERPHAQQMAIQAIIKATQHGRISAANAAIALMVIQDELPITKIANKLNITRGAVHQHLARVRSYLPAMIKTIEEPQFDFKADPAGGFDITRYPLSGASC